MRKLFLTPLFLILCTSFFSLSAQNWQPGFVIVNEADTLFGEINFRIPRLNQEQAVFRADANSPVQTFSPGEIAGYRIMPDGKFFVSRTIEIDGRPRLVFVEFLVQGMLNLFYFEGSRQSFYFFEDENGEMFSITREDFSNNRRNLARDDNRFDGMIRYRFQELAPIAQYPQRFGFNQRSMINVARMYHDLTCPIGSECIIFETQRPDANRFKVRLTPYIAVENNVFGFVYQDIAVRRTTSRSRPAMALGAELEMFSPQFSKNFRFFADMSISRINHTFEYINYREVHRIIGNIAHRYYFNKKFDFYPLTANIGIRYAYPIGRFTPKVSFGFSYRYFFGNASTSAFRVTNNTIYSNPTDFFLERHLRRDFPGFHASIGSSFDMRNGQGISLLLFLSSYQQGELTNPGSIRWNISRYLTTYGLRIGYVF